MSKQNNQEELAKKEELAKELAALYSTLNELFIQNSTTMTTCLGFIKQMLIKMQNGDDEKCQPVQ